MTTQEQVKQTLELVKTLADAIKESGEIPSGHLYAILNGYGCSMQSFDGIIGILKRAGLIKRRGNLLVWIGD